MILNNALIKGELKSLVIENGKIEKISTTPFENGEDLKGKRVIPGLIDVHTHGCNNMDTMDADFKPMCEFYAQHGTTSFLPTTMTLGTDSLLNVTEADTDFFGANILGFHLEGPFISKKYKGAQNEEFIRLPSLEEFEKYKNVSMISLAPELEGSCKFIREASKRCVVSIGHTNCDYETALAAIDAGALCLTHTYNAMPPLHHRNPGPIGAGFERGIYAQVICDGFHVAKPVVLATYKMFTADRMVLISDSIRCAGLADGEYESGGLKVYLKDSAARLADGTIAGSCAMLFDCVKKAVEFGIPFDDAVKMATETPAKMLKVNKGQIKEGFDADLIIIDDNFNIESVIIGGKKFK